MKPKRFDLGVGAVESSRSQQLCECVLSHFSCVRLDPMDPSPQAPLYVLGCIEQVLGGLPYPPLGIFLTRMEPAFLISPALLKRVLYHPKHLGH